MNNSSEYMDILKSTIEKFPDTTYCQEVTLWLESETRENDEITSDFLRSESISAVKEAKNFLNKLHKEIIKEHGLTVASTIEGRTLTINKFNKRLNFNDPSGIHDIMIDYMYFMGRFMDDVFIRLAYIPTFKSLAEEQLLAEKNYNERMQAAEDINSEPIKEKQTETPTPKTELVNIINYRNLFTGIVQTFDVSDKLLDSLRSDEVNTPELTRMLRTVTYHIMRNIQVEFHKTFGLDNKAREVLMNKDLNVFRETELRDSMKILDYISDDIQLNRNNEVLNEIEMIIANKIIARIKSVLEFISLTSIVELPDNLDFSNIDGLVVNEKFEINIDQ